MSRKYLFEHPYRLFAWIFMALLFLLVIEEGWRYAVKPNPESKKQALSEILDEVSTLFTQQEQTLLIQSRKLAAELQKQLDQRSGRRTLYESLQQSPGIWGSALYQRDQPVVWNSFSLDLFQDALDSNRSETYVDVKKQNNVLFWIAHISFRVATEGGEIPYQLFTAKRIEQTNALPIAGELEYSILNEIPSVKSHSINIGIYDPMPENTTDYRVLRSLKGDSVGVAYAIGNSMQELTGEWQRSNRFWRAIFTLVCFVVMGLLLYMWLDVLKAWKSLFFQLIIIGIGWIVFNHINIAEVWLPPLLQGLKPEIISSYQKLCDFSITGIFFLAVAFTLKRKLSILRFQLHSTSFFSSIFAAFGIALINIAAILFIFRTCYELTNETAIPVMTLQIFPGVGTLLFYLGMGITFWALTIALLAINQFLLRSCEQQYKLATAICVSSFISGLLIAQLYVEEFLFLNWVFIISTIYFSLVFAIAFIYFRFPYSIPRSSPLRNAAIYSFIIATACSTIIYQSKIRSIDAELRRTVESFGQQQDKTAEALTETILLELNDRFNKPEDKKIEDRVSFVQTQFNQTIESVIQNQEGLYSYDLQLIGPDDELLADYSTNLNSPDWVDIFRTRRFEAVLNIQQITKNNVRPIIQQPQLQGNQDYQTFYRGWIPIFGTNIYHPVAWVLCSVYRERPDFNKPMRAVMASLNYRDWENSYVIQEYKNERLRKTIYQGVGGSYPIYNKMQGGEKRALKEDSTVYYTNVDNNLSYRNFLAKQPEDVVIKSSTILPGYQNILFSFFQLSFTLLIAGFIILLIYQWINTGRIVVFGASEQFQYRILDSFLMATLLFMVLVVFATHFAIERQNTELVEEQLSEKLESIAAATKKNMSFQRDADSSLDSLTAPLNVDASFYSNRLITESTTPQIYQQHLLPNALPYPVYSDLFLSQKREALTKVMLDRQSLIIGYRSVLSNDKTPAAAVAIPTFVKSPKFNKQLLETTSYLIILYLVIFGLFIIGTTIISRQLTRPLYYIQKGLNKISKGNLDTTIPATSNDEIGSLATAYNHMVGRLKDLQQELAAAEREAAWQEMAQQVAHEIKNPLTPMKLNIQHLQRQLASGDYTVEELKDKIQATTRNLIVQIQSLNNIASDFSNFSKPIKEEFEAVDMNKLVHSVVDLYNHDDQIKIDTSFTPADALVYGAKDELRRVIINLVKNAHEAMNGGGSIKLRTYRRQQSLFVEVEDDGQGIDEEDKPRIFVPNFSTKSSGTGLGLAICKKVVESHKGSISFASIEGKGTTFIIKLPLNGV